jgi:hypothetical protein
MEIHVDQILIGAGAFFIGALITNRALVFILDRWF